MLHPVLKDTPGLFLSTCPLSTPQEKRPLQEHWTDPGSPFSFVTGNFRVYREFSVERVFLAPLIL